jgi:hypothetical protein
VRRSWREGLEKVWKGKGEKEEKEEEVEGEGGGEEEEVEEGCGEGFDWWVGCGGKSIEFSEREEWR